MGNFADVGAKYGMVLETARLLGYDAIAPAASDYQVSPALRGLAAEKGVALVPELRGPVSAYPPPLLVIRGQVRTALAALPRLPASDVVEVVAPYLRRMRTSAQLVILLSSAGLRTDREIANSPATRGLADLIVETDEVSPDAQPIGVGPTAIVVAQHGGESVGELCLELEGDGWVCRETTHPVLPSLPLDTRVFALVSQALRQQSIHESGGGTLLSPGARGYAPPSSCRRCHEPEAEACRGQPHASSMDALRREGRVVRECVTCHSEYFRMTGQLALLPTGEDGVQCATCHGDGVLHAVSGRKDQIFRKVPEELCRSCHNQERDPDFDYAKALERIRHW